MAFCPAPASRTDWMGVGARLGHRLVSLLALLACLALLSYFISLCVRKYLEGSTATAESYSHTQRQPFPQLTCNPTLTYAVAAAGAVVPC